jgi:hypothetical protein
MEIDLRCADARRPFERTRILVRAAAAAEPMPIAADSAAANWPVLAKRLLGSG